MEIQDLPEFILNSRFLSTRYLIKLAEMESVPEFDKEICDGTIKTACDLLDGQEKEVVLTRQAIQLMNTGDIAMAWQALLAIQI